MERDSKYCIMKSGRSMGLTLIIFLMSLTPRMVVRGWLLF
uniref:Prolyl 4-hydroxylase 5-2 n=1 Tax=Zea mays TaxID=4577 RepID=G4XT48_MAIZE|nr:prolyl 4-hydroxylase 5-2 [Zea mays]